MFVIVALFIVGVGQELKQLESARLRATSHLPNLSVGIYMTIGIYMAENNFNCQKLIWHGILATVLVTWSIEN